MTIHINLNPAAKLRADMRKVLDPKMEQARKRLEEIKAQYAHDPEEAHSRADGVLCGILLQLGYQDVVDAFEGIKKWYA